MGYKEEEGAYLKRRKRVLRLSCDVCQSVQLGWKENGGKAPCLNLELGSSRTCHSVCAFSAQCLKHKVHKSWIFYLVLMAYRNFTSI